MPFVFISYSRQDREEASALAKVLQSQGIEVWWDNDLSPGDRFDHVLEQRIRAAEAVVVIWSDGSCISHWVLSEARLARDLNKLIPVHLPGFNLRRIPFHLNDIHSIDLNQTGTLVQALQKFMPLKIEQIPSIDSEFEEKSTYRIPLFDSALEKKSPARCRRLQELRAQHIQPTLEKIPITHYSHDSHSHAVQCTNLVTELFLDAMSMHLTELELFILGVFCYVHDIGMDARPGMEPERIYKSHNVYAQEFVFKLRKKQLLDDIEADCVAALCLMHNKDLERARPHFEFATGIRLAVIFSMFRIADMLDVETQSGEILRIKPEIVAQVIGELEFDRTSRTVKIWRGYDIEDDEFTQWSNFFSTRLQSLNEELRKVDAEISWEAVEVVPSGIQSRFSG
jgi:hypothetical protein